MSDPRTEERLRDALQAVRRQSVGGVPGAGGAPRDDDGLADLDDGDGPRQPARWWVPAIAAVVVLLLGLVLAGRASEETNVVASRSEQEQAHAAAVAEVVAGCRRYQATRPADPAPLEAPAELPAWFDRYDAAQAEALSGLDDAVVPAEDRAVIDEAADALERGRRALAQARAAAERGDDTEAIRLVDQARYYETIGAFALAEWGAAECDARGVTRPTR